eukprot:5675211-Amphidinium_carterae.1
MGAGIIFASLDIPKDHCHSFTLGGSANCRCKVHFGSSRGLGVTSIVVQVASGSKHPAWLTERSRSPETKMITDRLRTRIDLNVIHCPNFVSRNATTGNVRSSGQNKTTSFTRFWDCSLCFDFGLSMHVRNSKEEDVESICGLSECRSQQHCSAATIFVSMKPSNAHAGTCAALRLPLSLEK